MSRALLAVGLLGLGVAGWLAFDNPTIDGTSRGDGYPCLAPWDTVLNDADNYPGGEPPRDGDSIAQRCRHIGQERFDRAAAAGSSATVVLLGAGALTASSRRRPSTWRV